MEINTKNDKDKKMFLKALNNHFAIDKDAKILDFKFVSSTEDKVAFNIGNETIIMKPENKD